MITHALTITALALVLVAPASGQIFEDYAHTVEAPYAGRYEARIGGSGESENDKIRLDIGASIDVLSIRDSTVPAGTIQRERSRFSLGADFFTWSRLRSEDNFKFPVELVDYYFGANVSLRLGRFGGQMPLISEIRLRIGHISAHRVDGHSQQPFPQQPPAYSRELIDAMIASDGERLARAIGASDASIRPYIGALYLFHVVPTVESAATPYAGVDGYIPIVESVPLVLRYGYEARLNTEAVAAIGEHHARLGLKLGRPHSNGVTIETSYFSGRSTYGQLFGERESYLSLGFAIDY